MDFSKIFGFLVELLPAAQVVAEDAEAVAKELASTDDGATKLKNTLVQVQAIEAAISKALA